MYFILNLRKLKHNVDTQSDYRAIGLLLLGLKDIYICTDAKANLRLDGSG